MTEYVDIGLVIRRSGLPATTLHVWERRGLIAPAARSGLRRQYPPDIFDRLATIVVLQDAGFRLDEIAALLQPGAFDDGKQLLETKISELRQRRDRLDHAIDGIQHAIDCPNPTPLECTGFREHLDHALPRGHGAQDSGQIQRRSDATYESSATWPGADAAPSNRRHPSSRLSGGLVPKR